MIGWIILGIAVVAVFYVVGIYNGLVQGRMQVREGWSGIDVQLKRRHDLIPNLVETVKGYMGHEKGVLEEVARLRSQATGATALKERAALENNITRAIGAIFAIVENYPDLKANQSFLDLQKSLSGVEEEIQLARRYYNGTVRDYNIQVQSFPSNLIANAFHFETQEFFEIETASERQAPAVKFDSTS